MSDPFEHFEEQERSLDLLQPQQINALKDDARELVAEHPEMQPVGLVFAPDASEAVSMRDAIERATGQSLAGRGFFGVVPREFALAILRANAPATLDWLEPPTTGPERKLSIVIATKNGFRVLSVDYQVFG